MIDQGVGRTTQSNFCFFEHEYITHDSTNIFSWNQFKLINKFNDIDIEIISDFKQIYMKRRINQIIGVVLFL